MLSDWMSQSSMGFLTVVPFRNGKLTEDGVLPEKYNLQEMTTKSYPKRTEKNVVDSDGTVIFTNGRLTSASNRDLPVNREKDRI